MVRGRRERRASRTRRRQGRIHSLVEDSTVGAVVFTPPATGYAYLLPHFAWLPIAAKLGIGSAETLRKFDAFSRRVIGWRAATSMTTDLVLDALEHAMFPRAQEGVTDLTGLVAHSDAGSQYTSIAFTTRPHTTPTTHCGQPKTSKSKTCG